MRRREFSFDFIFRNRMLMHILFWLVVLCYFTLGYGKPGFYRIELKRSLAFLPNHMFITYTFIYFLIPRFLLTRKLVAFFCSAIVVVGFGMFFSYLINIHFLGSFGLQTWWSIGLSLLGQFTVLGIAVSIKLLKSWYLQKQQTMQAEQEKLSAELELLKSQIHPHFLFNTLNNLYSHTLDQSEKAPAIVLKLSELLRFMIYESNSEVIALSSEISLLKNYIELEQLRYGDRLDISISITTDTTGRNIAPLILLPFVENAFKHGTSRQIDQCWITLDIQIEKDILYFKLVNSKTDDKLDLQSGGLGLSNVKRRLELIYKDGHRLEVNEDNDVFIVNLQLQLKALQLKKEIATDNKKLSLNQPVYDLEMPVS